MTVSEQRRRVKAAQLHGALMRVAALEDRQARGENVEGIDGLTETRADVDELRAELAALGGDPDVVAARVAETLTDRLRMVRTRTPPSEKRP